MVYYTHKPLSLTSIIKTPLPLFLSVPSFHPHNTQIFKKKMSGGVGPSCSDIQNEQENKTFSKKHPRFLTFRHLNALVLIIVLSARGMVSVEDFAFVVFSLVYVFFISTVAFPSQSTHIEPPVFGEKNKILSLYVLVAAIIGLFLPIAYIVEGVFEGDKEGVKAATPHLFLLASQVFMEGVAFGGNFSIPVQVFVPVFYNSRRIFTLVDWLRNEIYKVELENSDGSRRLYIGRGLAMANMAFWCFNLFGFLLPIYLPKAFKMHYSRLKGKE